MFSIISKADLFPRLTNKITEIKLMYIYMKIILYWIEHHNCGRPDILILKASITNFPE